MVIQMILQDSALLLEIASALLTLVFIVGLLIEHFTAERNDFCQAFEKRSLAHQKVRCRGVLASAGSNCW